MGSQLAPNWTGQFPNVSLPTLQKIQRPLWAGNSGRLIIRPLSRGETGPSRGPQHTLSALHRSPTRGSSNLTRPLDEGPLLPPSAAWLQGVLFYKSENSLSDGHSYRISIGWLRGNLHIAQTRTYLDIPSFCFLDAYPQLMVHSRNPPPPLYSWLSANKTRRRNQQACYHCSLINTIHAIALTKDLDTLIWTNLASNTYAKVIEGTITHQLVT